MILACCWLAGDVYVAVENIILRETQLGAIAQFLDKLPPAVGNPIFLLSWLILMVGWTIPLGLGFKRLFRQESSS